MTRAALAGTRCMQKKERHFPFYRTGKMKYCNSYHWGCYIKKSRQSYLSVPKRFVNMYIIFMKSCMSATGWKQSTNISEDHERIFRLYFQPGLIRLPFQFEPVIIPVHICHAMGSIYFD